MVFFKHVQRISINLYKLNKLKNINAKQSIFNVEKLILNV